MKLIYRVEEDFKIISNPTEEIFTIYFGKELSTEYNYELIDCVGRKLLIGNFEKGERIYNLDVKDRVKSGIYAFRVYNDEERYITTVRKD